MTSEILFTVEGRVGRMRLNRPKAIHALTQAMCAAMIEQLLAWHKDAAIEAVLIDHAGDRGFCAGGDVRVIAESADKGVAAAFFYSEYQLNHLLFTYPKPIIAFMDGVTMGGGVGISQPATYRIATERTIFAMPETTIGLFPDVGGGWYLSRLPGRIGQYLALTGARLDGGECRALGLATHYIPSDALDAVKGRIIAAPHGLAAILEAAAIPTPQAEIDLYHDTIRQVFEADRYEDILAALDDEEGDWAADQREVLAGKSPQSCKISLRLLQEGRERADFTSEMAAEYRIASRVCRLPDFAEGVRARLVDKDNSPRWQPSTPEEVTDAALDAIFAPLPDDQEWVPVRV